MYGSGIGGGTVLGAATVLPATGALGLWFAGNTNYVVIYGLLAISIFALLLNMAKIIRYFSNSKKSVA